MAPPDVSASGGASPEIDLTDRQADMTVPGEAQAYYWAHVDDNTNDCTLWPYAAVAGGYGALRVEGRTRPVHVLACERHYGPMPKPGMLAIHFPVICHNRLCFNWRHLRWGTRKQNRTDTVPDGTINTGERNGQARLTWEQVTKIRAQYAMGGISQRALAVEHGVSSATIWHIVNQHTWRN